MSGAGREAQLSRAFVQLADTLVADFDLIDFLQTLVDTCATVLDIEAAGLLLATGKGGLELMASTSERAELVELVQLGATAGPCWDCAQTGRPEGVPDIAEAGDRWPAFQKAALQQGFRSVHAIPMSLRDEVIGTLNLFGVGVGALGDADVRAAQALADVATIGIITERSTRERAVVTEQLQYALESRVLIEQAKGIVAESNQVTMEAAFDAMRRFARSSNRTIRGVAAALIDRSLAPSALPVTGARRRPPPSPSLLAGRPAPPRR